MALITSSTMRLLIAILALYLRPVFSLIVMVPLYAYLGGSGLSAWTSLTNIIRSHPEVQYLVVINPDSGPGSTTYPDSNYIDGVARLNSFSNVNLIGYVDTWFTSVALETVYANIDKYADWAAYEQADIALHGIFFDDMTTNANTTAYDYMSSVSNYAYSSFADSSRPTVVFNPGCKVDATYFRWADYIIEFEDSLLQYKGLASVKRKKLALRQKQAIIAHTATPGPAELKQLLSNMYKQHIGAVYMTTECCYDVMSSGQLDNIWNYWQIAGWRMSRTSYAGNFNVISIVTALLIWMKQNQFSVISYLLIA